MGRKSWASYIGIRCWFNTNSGHDATRGRDFVELFVDIGICDIFMLW